MTQIHLGYEIRTGRLVSVPLHHTAVIGRTRDSGKTTTLEAMVHNRLVNNPATRFLAFITKRGEDTFSFGKIIPPFYQGPAQNSESAAGESMWEFIASLLETSTGEKLKIQRTAIMRVSQAGEDWPEPRTLRDVAHNVDLAVKHTRRGFELDMYFQLQQYFVKVLPQIERLPKTPVLELRPGLNVMYLDNHSPETQALCIASCLKFIMAHESNVITILPESWKFTKDNKATPALPAAVMMVREGGVVGNFLWLDSQDLVGIDAEIRKQVGVWILGVQGESIEAERTLRQLPTDINRLRMADIQRLRLGQFYVSSGKGVRLTYVQPYWMEGAEAMMVATSGEAPRKGPNPEERIDEMWRARAEELEGQIADLEAQLAESRADGEDLRRKVDELNTVAAGMAAIGPSFTGTLAVGPDRDEAFKVESWFCEEWVRVRERVARDPVFIELLKSELSKRRKSGKRTSDAA